MLRPITFNGIRVKTNQDRHIIVRDKDILVLRKQWGKLLTSMFLSSSLKEFTRLHLKKNKKSKELQSFKSLFQEKARKADTYSMRCKDKYI